jgi:hypothetical protein
MPVSDIKVFIHIPKCGGNSVEAKLRFNRIPFTRIEPEVKSENMPDAELITGHISYDQFAGEDRTRFFSVMRSPLSRAVSHYYYNLRIREQSPEYGKMMELGFDEFLLTNDNPMCRHMFGNKIFDSPDNDEIKYDLCMDIMKRRYEFVGTMDSLQYLDDWLLSKFGGRCHEAHENRNDNDYPKAVAASTRIKFMQKNIVDYMIYEFVGKYWENAD